MPIVTQQSEATSPSVFACSSQTTMSMRYGKESITVYIWRIIKAYAARSAVHGYRLIGRHCGLSSNELEAQILGTLNRLVERLDGVGQRVLD